MCEGRTNCLPHWGKKTIQHTTPSQSCAVPTMRPRPKSRVSIKISIAPLRDLMFVDVEKCKASTKGQKKDYCNFFHLNRYKERKAPTLHRAGALRQLAVSMAMATG